MAQPDIVIDQKHTTVVEKMRVGTARDDDPSIMLHPATSTVEVGGTSDARPDGRISLLGAAAQGSSNQYNTRVSLHAAPDASTPSRVDVTHPDGAAVGLQATPFEPRIDLTDQGGSAALSLSANGQFSTIETGGAPRDPWLLLRRTDQQEILAFPRVAVGSPGERRQARPGEVELIGRTTGSGGKRRVSVRLDGGINTPGGRISVRDTTETENVVLEGQQAAVNVGGSEPGTVELTGDPGNGVTTVRLQGKPQGSPGGRIAMKDNTRATNVELRAADGLLVLGSTTSSGGTYGQIHLDDSNGETLAISAQDGTVSIDYGSEGTILEIETNPSSGTKEIRTKYAVKENVSSL